MAEDPGSVHLWGFFVDRKLVESRVNKEANTDWCLPASAKVVCTVCGT